jgi:hypothetical protein
MKEARLSKEAHLYGYRNAPSIHFSIMCPVQDAEASYRLHHAFFT